MMSESSVTNVTSSASSSSCFCQNCPQNIRILLDASSAEFFNYLEYHATVYREQNPHINIKIDAVPNLSEQLLDPTNWDATIFPSQFLGNLAEKDILWDLTHFIQTSTDLDWAEILPFFRNPYSVYFSSSDSDNESNDEDNTDILGIPRLIPLDGDFLSMYYRRDLFQQYNITIPRTWEEYNQAAAFFDGMPLGPGGSPLFGSCVSRVDRCANEYWTSLILATMTQAHGTSSGFFLDPSTLEPLFGPAMQETLRILREQFSHGHDDELAGDCLASNFAFNEGKCALTYNWGNQITGSEGAIFDIGVAPTPGSPVILDRHANKLVNCTIQICPHAVFFDDIGLVNPAPYAAYGGWAAGVSSQAPEGRQYAAAEFLAYVSNSRQSLDDVLPNNLSSFAQPYRYSHITSSNWIDAGYGRRLASDYTEAIRQVNSENTVLELRFESAASMREIVDQEVFQYLFDTINPLSSEEDLALRRQTTSRMEQQIREIVTAEDRRGLEVRLSDAYRRSIGYTDMSDQDLMNYINEDFRDAAWGLSGLMCVTAVSLMIWTFRHRNNRVMKAFQPFLLFQSTIGLLLMSSSIIPLGFDDSFYDVEILDITCMLSPWLYVVGFTIFFSSVYAKIRECIKIYEDPQNNTILLVRPNSCLRFCVRILILNGTILGLWTGTDPLRWKRQEVDGGIVLEDGTVETYGACRGDNVALGFQLALFALNMTMALIATLQAFKCRFLVLEYNEMQWLPLSVFPFLEVWIVGGPILALVREDPTVTFVVLTMMIVVSTTVAGMAVFAPKDWYIRKYYHANPKQSNGFPERTSSAGIMVLQHPTVESQKQIESLCFKVEQMEGWNTELEIEIRLIKEKFKELTASEKFHIHESIIRDAMTDNDTNEYRSSKGMEEYEQNEMMKRNDEGLAAMEHFQQVWKMPEDDEDEDNQVASMPKPTSYQSLQSLTSSLGNDDDAGFYRRSVHKVDVESAPDKRQSEQMFSRQNYAAPFVPETMSYTSSEPHEDHLANFPGYTDDDHHIGAADGSLEQESFDTYNGDGTYDNYGTHDHSDLVMTGFDRDEDDDENDDHDDDDDDNEDYVPKDPLVRLAKTGFDDKDDNDDDDAAPQAPRSRLAMTGFDESEDEEDYDAPPQPLSRLAMTGFDDDDTRINNYQDPSPRLTMTGFNDNMDEDDDNSDNEVHHDPLARLAMTGFHDHKQKEISDDDDDDYNDGPQDPLTRLARIVDQDDDDNDESAVHALNGSIESAPTGDSKEERASINSMVARIIAMRLAATDAGNVTENDSVRSTRDDPLERLMRMSADNSSEESAGDQNNHKNAETVRSQLKATNETSNRAVFTNHDVDDLPDKDIIARIIALRLAAADEEEGGGNNSVHSTPEDPLERIMNMNAEDQLISAVTLMRYLGPEGEDEDEDDTIIRNKDFRDLSSMIQDNELEELERRAASLAESVKTKLNASNLADLTRETETTVDSDTGLGYLALAKGGHKDVVNTSHVMNGLDISKISDDGDRRFVSMSDSILDSPGRVKKVGGQSQPLLGAGAEFPNGGTKLSAGESSTDVKQRKTLSAAASAALDQDSGYVTQFAGEPSQGESSRLGLGLNGSSKKESINDEAFRSPSVPKKRLTNTGKLSFTEPDSPVNKSYLISDWAAVGGLANVLADWSDSQSSTSCAESNPDSVTSYEATTRASLLDTPTANELDQLVGKMDWEGVKTVAHNYETSAAAGPTATSQSFDVNTSTLSALEDKRRKKRELEAWRESLTKSFTKS